MRRKKRTSKKEKQELTIPCTICLNQPLVFVDFENVQNLLIILVIFQVVNKINLTLKESMPVLFLGWLQ